MEEVQEEVPPTQTAVLVVYDHDNTKSKRHTGGVLFQCAFEKPWARNIRAYACFQQHVRLLQACENPKVVLGAATFGEYRERIVNSWAALGIDEDSILICAKFVRKSMAKYQGKNMHIAMLLQEHYRRHPEIRITQVYLLDDDDVNIKAAEKYSLFIQNEPWDSDSRLNVPVEGILVPKPELVMPLQRSLYASTGGEPQTHHDKCLNMEVDREEPLSEWRFLRVLKVLEKKLGIENNGLNFRQFEPRKSLKKDQAKEGGARKLARSFDSPGFLPLKRKPLKEVVNLNRSADDWNNTPSNLVSEDDENNDEIKLLFKSV